METRWIGTSQEWRRAWDDNWRNSKLQRTDVFVAYCSHNGAVEIQKAHQHLKVPLRMVVGLNDGVTDIEAREKLSQWAKANSQVEIRGRFQHSGRFHPKIYVFYAADSVHLLTGSVNLTKSAFHQNTESAVEWIMSHHEANWCGVLATLSDWWNEAEPLRAPNEIEIEVTRLGIEERVIETMKQGVLVNIEAHLATARSHFQSDVFQLGATLKANEGLMAAERMSSAFIALTGMEIYKELENCRERAHKNCGAFSFMSDAGHFVPTTALATWRKQHRKIIRPLA